MSRAPQQPVGPAGGDVSRDVETTIQHATGQGQPLLDDVRGLMEGAFETDCSNVKVHTGARADDLNRSMSGHASLSHPRNEALP